MEKGKRNVELILYDIDKVGEILEKVSHLDMEYAYIRHDKDLNDSGVVKKAHYHFMIFSDTQRTITAWSSLLDVPSNMIENIKNKISAIRYLIHCDNNDKYQYQIEDICTNIEIAKYFKNTISNENNEIELIIYYIFDHRYYMKYKELLDYVLSNGFWSTYRRNYSIIKDLLYEHNLLFTSIRK